MIGISRATEQPNNRGASAAAAAMVGVVCGLALAGRAEAQQAEPAVGQAPSVWLYSLYKTTTYETATNLADIPLYSTLLAGAAGGATLFTTVNVLTAAAAYYSYEVAWNLYGPPIGGPLSDGVATEIQKTLIYRVVSSARNAVLVRAFSASPSVTLGFVLISNAVDGAIYIANEYAWYAFGPPAATVWRQ